MKLFTREKINHALELVLQYCKGKWMTANEIATFTKTTRYEIATVLSLLRKSGFAEKRPIKRRSRPSRWYIKPEATLDRLIERLLKKQ